MVSILHSLSCSQVTYRTVCAAKIPRLTTRPQAGAIANDLDGHPSMPRIAAADGFGGAYIRFAALITRTLS